MIRSAGLEMLLRRPVPAGIPPAAYRSIVQHVHAVAKDQLDSVDTLHSYVARILPVYVEKSRQHKSTRVSLFPGNDALILIVCSSPGGHVPIVSECAKANEWPGQRRVSAIAVCSADSALFAL